MPTATVPARPTSPHPTDATRAVALARWSWVMLPALLGSLSLAFVMGSVLIALLDVPEGDLLVSHGTGGVVAGVAVLLVMLLPLPVGVVLAIRSYRLGGGRDALGALVVNALVLVGLLTAVIAQAVSG